MLKKSKAKIKSSKFFDGVNLSIFAVIFVVIGGYFVLKSLAATPPTLYLTPASSSVNASADFTVQIRENSDTIEVNAVQANLTYPTNLLDVTSIDTSGSAFSTVAESTSASGVINFGAGTATGASGVSGDQLVATIHFKSKTVAGTANVSFTTGTALVESATNTEILGGLDNTVGGTYTVNVSTPAGPSGHIYLTPASSTVVTNTAFNVEIRENSGAATVNAVQANLTYPASSLDVIGINTSSGAFSLVAESSAINGVINIGLGIGAGTQPKTGDQPVATIQFKSKTAIGVSNVAFAAGTAILDSTTNSDILGTLTNASGGAYTINEAPAVPATGGGGQPSNPGASSQGGGTGTTNTKKTGTNTATSTSNTQSSTSEPTQPNEDSNETFNTQDEATIEQGSTVTVRVVNSNGKPVNGVEVTLDGTSKKTDKNGQATFTNVLPGKQQVKIKGSTKSYTIDVSASTARLDEAAEQVFTLKVASGSSTWKYIVGVLIVLVIVIALGILGNRRPRGPSGTITPQAVDLDMEQKAVVMQNKD